MITETLGRATCAHRAIPVLSMFFDRPVPNRSAELVDAPGQTAAVLPTAGNDIVTFDEMVRLHSGRVFNFVFQMTRQRQDAEDLVQQTFIKAYHNLHRFDGTRPVINWLLTIARRTTLNHFRNFRNWEELPESATSSEPCPAVHAEQREDKETLWNDARRLLSQREFEILWLRFGEDLSIEETARIAGLTQTHVKVIVYRAKQQLMKAHAK